MSVWRAREMKNAETYGSARWASEKEVRAAGLLGGDGVVLGKLGRDYLRHDGPEHVLCFAPTRSGKGVGLVIPSLLTWPGSAIVHDIKGENWQLTAGFRARHGRVLLFDPTNAASAAYNPLLEVRRGQWEVRDVQNVADVLVDPEGSLERRNHWDKTSHSLLVGAIPARALCGSRQDVGRGGLFPLRSLAHDRTDAGGDDGDASPWRSRRASRGRLCCARTAEQVGQRALGRAQYRDVVPRPLPRSCRCAGYARVPVADSGSSRGRASVDALSGRAAKRHLADQAAHPPDPQPDRPPPDRGTDPKAESPPRALDARRISLRSAGSTSSSPRWRSWPAMD